MRRTYGSTALTFVLGTLAAVPAASVHAQTGQTTAGAKAPQPLTWSASLRTRAESWDWFDPGAAGKYVYSGSIARAGITYRHELLTLRFEGAAPVLLGLPADAVAPAPAGPLGLGANYYTANDNDRNAAAVFLKNAYVEVGRATGHRLRAGRTEFSDGSETTPTSPTLAAVKRDRIAQRLIGPFGWSHVGRSYDGLLYGYTQGRSNVTALAARTTRGAFDVNGWDELKAGVVYAAASTAGPWSPTRSDLRLFGLYYRDDRALPKVDNRPAAVRAADSTDVAITTIGAHALQEVATGAGPIDLLAWGAVQFGDWGRQTQRAWAGALEAGFQPAGLPALRPWLRVGLYRASGDHTPGDDRHQTFVPILPTPRIYARFPFYTTMNLDEAFGSLTLRPGKTVTLRGDVRALGLAAREDLWYAGGGAFEANSFGYAGRPSGGARRLATLLDLSADWRVRPWATLTGYVAHAPGSGVVRATYGANSSATLGYLEVELRRP